VDIRYPLGGRDTLVCISGIVANITLQQDGGQHNHEIFCGYFNNENIFIDSKREDWSERYILYLV